MKKLILIPLIFILSGCNWFDTPVSPSKQSVITFFSADNANIFIGQSTTIRWDAQASTTCRIDFSIGNVPTTGFLVVSPIITTTYILTCSNDGQNPANRQLTIIVK
jgi:hypothetical protein